MRCGANYSAYETGQVLSIPIPHGEGNYFCDPATLDELEREGRVIFRYCDVTGQVSDEANPNGSLNNIAGVVNEQRNVFGLMPHPEHASEKVLGGEDGLKLFRSVIAAHREGGDRRTAAVAPGH